jgi:metal-responsive CopG/Arc/MetJ family transcriptional regulator
MHTFSVPLDQKRLDDMDKHVTPLHSRCEFVRDAVEKFLGEYITPSQEPLVRNTTLHFSRDALDRIKRAGGRQGSAVVIRWCIDRALQEANE